MVLAVGEILFELIPGLFFAHVLVLLCLKCIGLISSLAIMRDREAGALAGTFTHASGLKYG